MSELSTALLAAAIAGSNGGGGTGGGDTPTVNTYNKTEIDSMLGDKVDKEDGKGLSTNDYTDEEKAKLASLSNYDDSEMAGAISDLNTAVENVLSDLSGKASKSEVASVESQVAINRATLGYQRRNLMKYSATSKTNNGITYTVNEDGSITANGTATANSTFILTYIKDLSDDWRAAVDGRDVILSGCPSGGGSSSYKLNCFRGGSLSTMSDFGSGVEFEFDSSEFADNANFAIVVASGKTLNNQTFYPMLRYAEIEDDSYEPYKSSVHELIDEIGNYVANEMSQKVNTALSQSAVNSTTLGYQSKNLLDNIAVSKTLNGLSYTVNEDKSVTLNGTVQSGKTSSFYVSEDLVLPKTMLRKTKGFLIGSFDKSTGAWVATVVGTNTELFDASTFDYDNYLYKANIQRSSGNTYDNTVIYPMVWLVDIDDDTYEPYRPNVDKRITDTNDIALVNAATLGYPSKNLLKLTATTKTVNGVTYTVNADGSITANGTATENAQITISDINLTIGKSYTLTGCPTGGSSETYRLYGLEKETWTGAGSDTGGGVTFTAKKSPTTYRIVVYAGKTVTNLTFYPMLRYAEIQDDTYEPYKPSVQAQIDALTNMLFGLGEAIPNSANLNDYKDAGVFYVASSGEAATIQNVPLAGAGFRMEVKYTSGKSRCIQMLYYNSMVSLIYVRSFGTNGWGSWYKLNAEVVTST